MAARRPFVGGNHKMNGTKESLSALLKHLNSASLEGTGVEVVVAPPTILVSGSPRCAVSRLFLLTPLCRVVDSAQSVAGRQTHRRGRTELSREAQWRLHGRDEPCHAQRPRDRVVRSAPLVLNLLSVLLTDALCLGSSSVTQSGATCLVRRMHR